MCVLTGWGHVHGKTLSPARKLYHRLRSEVAGVNVILRFNKLNSELKSEEPPGHKLTGLSRCDVRIKTRPSGQDGEPQRRPHFPNLPSVQRSDPCEEIINDMRCEATETCQVMLYEKLKAPQVKLASLKTSVSLKSRETAVEKEKSETNVNPVQPDESPPSLLSCMVIHKGHSTPFVWFR